MIVFKYNHLYLFYTQVIYLIISIFFIKLCIVCDLFNEQDSNFYFILIVKLI